MKMRAKFRLNKITRHNETCEELEFNAVTTAPFDKDGVSEDNDFSRWTPTANLKMTITNPNLIGTFKEDTKFYLDFIEAE